MESQAGLVIDRLTQAYPGSAPTLHNLNLHLGAGELMTLLGASGSGKTTLLRCIAGLESYTGSITLEGRALKQGEVGYVFQKPVLYPHYTVEENILFAGGLKAWKGCLDTAHYRLLLELLGLEGLQDRYPDQLSGGQAQRVGIARALARKPRLVLFDEPLASVDEQLSASIRTDLQNLHRQLGFSALYITHDQDEALQLGQRLALLEAGSILAVQTPEELLSAPASLAAARLVHPHYGSLTLGRQGREVKVGLRAYGWQLLKDAGAASLTGRLRSVTVQTSGLLAELEVPAQNRVRLGGYSYLTLSSASLYALLPFQERVEVGQEVHLFYPSEGVHYYRPDGQVDLRDEEASESL